MREDDSAETPAARSMILKGICPVCRTGPWIAVARHTGPAHGVSALDLRNMAGLKAGDSICSPILSAHHSRLTTQMWKDGAFDPEQSARNSLGHKKNFTDAGLQAKRDLAAVLHDCWLVAARKERLRRVDRFRKLGADWQALCRLADEIGVDLEQVKRSLEAEGVDAPDGRRVSPMRFTPHPAMAGRPNLSARSLTPEQVDAVRAEYGKGGVSQSDLARRYGVGQSTISRAVRGIFVQPGLGL